MKEHKFDPDMTYFQSLKIVASGLIQWPINVYEAGLLLEALKDVGWHILCPIVRILMLASLPISAPLLTIAVQADRKKTARARETAKQKVRDRYMKNVRAQHEQE